MIVGQEKGVVRDFREQLRPSFHHTQPPSLAGGARAALWVLLYKLGAQNFLAKNIK